MKADQKPTYVAVLDGTTTAAGRQARALGAFLHAGVTWTTAPDGTVTQPTGVTLLFYAGEDGRERLVETAPTRDVVLVRTPPRRPDLMAAAVARFAEDTGASLFVFAGGPLGTELAARLACRSGGGIATDVLDIAVEASRLVSRRGVYSGHLTARVELGPRPWCVIAAAGWYDARQSPPVEHRVVADMPAPAADRGGEMTPPPFADVELLESPSTGDLEAARFLVVAGRGAGSPEGVERLAAAARRMGAAFGVTRPVAMNAWAPLDRLVGVSGNRVAPAVCLTAGASGAPAFLWGIERARFIAAVDTDEHAAIVTEADVAVLDDGVAVLEALAGLVAGEPAGPPD